MAPDYTAGSGDTLGIVRFGREELTQHERLATETIYPGQVVTPTTDADGNEAFALHDGTAGNDAYVVLEARGRGMDAQAFTDPDQDGYTDNDLVKAVRPSGGGLNLLQQQGTNAAEGDQLAVSTTNPGDVVPSDNADAGSPVVGFADTDSDLSGADTDALVAANMEG